MKTVVTGSSGHLGEALVRTLRSKKREVIGWKMFPGIDRVYVNERARNDLGWRPRYDFKFLLDRLITGADPLNPLARTVG
jgi:nucleoside-diphosphate-sugar epimerase